MNPSQTQREYTLPLGLVLKPPVTKQLLASDTKPDPDGAERFVEVIHKLRLRPPVEYTSAGIL